MTGTSYTEVATTHVVYHNTSSEEITSQVDARDPRQQASNAPEGTCTFMYFDTVDRTYEVDGERITWRALGGRVNPSKAYFVDAVLRDDAVLNSVERAFLDTFEMDAFVTCRLGHSHFFRWAEAELISIG